jgi:hypothetical protein
MRRVLSELRDSADVRAVLGDAVRPEPAWYLNGSPWVHGSVRHALYPFFFFFFFLCVAWKKGGDGERQKVIMVALIPACPPRGVRVSVCR